MFPIGIMYYFGTNLDEKFSTPDFWPSRDQTHKIPFDKDEITEELERLKQRRLAARARRLQLEGGMDGATNADIPKPEGPSALLQSLQNTEDRHARSNDGAASQNGTGWFSWLK